MPNKCVNTTNVSNAHQPDPNLWPDDFLASERDLVAIGLNPFTLQRARFLRDPDGPPFLKLGRGKKSCVRYRWADVKAWLASRRVDPRGAAA